MSDELGSSVRNDSL
jgi:hypothetical protein